MPETLPSKKISVVDIPEVEDFKATFNYNFFTPDERANEHGSAADKIIARPSEAWNTTFIDTIEFSRNTPRYTEFTWKTVNVGNREDINLGVSITTNIKKIHFEDDFTFKDYSSVHVQDDGLDGKLEFYVKKALESSTTPATGTSPQDLTRHVNSATPREVSSALIANAMNTPGSANMNFFSNARGSRQEIVSSVLDDVKKVQVRAQLNNKLIHKMIASAAFDDVITPFTDELTALIPSAQRVQSTAQKDRNSAVYTADEYDFQIRDYITEVRVDTDGYESIIQTIGYIIEKTEIRPDGSKKAYNPIIIDNRNIGNTLDVQIKYGSTYIYNIRTIAYIELQAHDITTNAVFAVGFLVGSRPTKQVVVCEEYIPPPVPSDFSISWDYKHNFPRLMWSMPPTPQRDVKKFQIFRRRFIGEPFQLIKMYDFDDSAPPSPYHELPDPSLVDRLHAPITHYIDEEFTKDSVYIYALCSIDAHGLSSGYSMQFEVAFDKQRNKLIRRMASVANAPKAYPNAFLNVDTFVDTIKDEGHGKLRVVFNPEYLRAHDHNLNDLGLLKTDVLDIYRLQIINIDLQAQQNIDIKLEDRTAGNLMRRPLRRTLDETLVDQTIAVRRPTVSQNITTLGQPFERR